MPRSAALFVRVEPTLVNALDRIAREERRVRMGETVTRNDVVRLILWEAVREHERTRKERREEP